MDPIRTISRKQQRALRKWAWLLKSIAALGRRSARRRRQAIRDLRRERRRRAVLDGPNRQCPSS